MSEKDKDLSEKFKDVAVAVANAIPPVIAYKAIADTDFVKSGKAEEAAKKALEMAIGSIAYPTVYTTQYVVSTINENLEAGKARNDKLVADCSKDHSLTEILTTAPLPSVCSAVKDVVAKRGK